VDAEVARGIRQVEAGDHDQAILTLDGATRRLAAKGDAPEELAPAYLYLGIAYLAKGLQTSAKVKFREAIVQQRDLTLSPEKFAPKVIELFEVAREEVAKLPALPPSSLPPRAKSGSRTEAFSATINNPLNQTGPAATNQDPRVWFTLLTPSAAGKLDATVTWNAQDATLELKLFEGPARGQPVFAQSTSTGKTSAQLSTSVTGQQYQLNVFYARCRTTTCPAAPFSLTVSVP
jgi:hypothetical protein